MDKHWKKNHGTSFTFFVDGYEIGEMSFISNSANETATFTIGQNHCSIKQKGFWNSNLSVIDTKEAKILNLYAEKWYANNWMVEYGGIKYKLSVRNNPLAEYVIIEGNEEILAYGLHADNGKVQVKITASSGQRDFIFDFLLWYLFVPVALENLGDNLAFSLLYA